MTHTREQKIEFLLSKSLARSGELEKALERNWLAHVILSGIAVATVFHIGDLPGVLMRHFDLDADNTQAIATILLPVVIYQFMRLGQLLTAFNEVRDVRDDLFKQYLGEAVDGIDMEPFRSSTSFLAESFAESVSWPVLLVSAFFVTSAQISTLILFVRTYGPKIPSLATLAVSQRPSMPPLAPMTRYVRMFIPMAG